MVREILAEGLVWKRSAMPFKGTHLQLPTGHVVMCADRSGPLEAVHLFSSHKATENAQYFFCQSRISVSRPYAMLVACAKKLRQCNGKKQMSSA